MTTTEPTVFVVDDDPFVRKALVAVMDSVGLKIETFGSAQEFLETRDSERAGCLVLDLRMPRMGGLELIDKLQENDDIIPVIFITGHGDVTTAVTAMKRGAFDFLEKPFSDQNLVDRIHDAIRLDSNQRGEKKRRDLVMDRIKTLTPRESQVMELVISGSSSKIIAASLGISLKTVEHHRIHLMDKMRVDSAVDLTREVVSSRLEAVGT